MTILPILDGELDLPAEEAAPDLPPDARPTALGQPIDPNGRIRLPVICHLVRADGRLILVDAGIGPWRWNGWARGRLDLALGELGVRPEEIDLVVTTHLHADHVGWCAVGGGGRDARPFFPSARYLVARREWEHWFDAARGGDGSVAYLGDAVAPLGRHAALDLVDGEAPITPSLSFVATPGHTPGHVAIGIASGGERALIVGDVTHYRAQLEHPDWSPVWDLDRAMAAVTRERIFRDLEDDPAGTLVTSHWPYPGIGRIVRVRGRRVFRGL